MLSAMAVHPAPLPSGTPSLRAAGLRQTPQRETILRVLRDADGPLTVEEIWHRMGEHRSGLPTIYRNLERFIQQGWAEGIPGQDQTMRFVGCHSRHHHHHLQCEGCGRMVEVDACGLESTIERMEERSGYKVTRHQVLFFGLCPECQAEKGR